MSIDKKIVSAMSHLYCENAAFYIAAQCNVVPIAWATTGVAKNALFEAFCKFIGYDYHLFIPSIHLPEDIGGCTDIDRKRKVSEVYPMEWIKQLEKPNQCLHIDEVNTAGPTMMPPLLSITNERRVGDIVFHPSTIIMCAANPERMAPNAAPLAGSMQNRLYHHDWVFPINEWIAGMKNGGVFETPDNFPIVGDYSAYLPKWTAALGNFAHRNRSGIVTEELPEGEQAFCSPRMLFNLSHCLAGADKVKADGETIEQLCNGTVGRDIGAQLIEFIGVMNLYDADEVIDGKVTVDYADDRVDSLIYLPAAIMDALKPEGRHGKARLDKAVEVLLDMGDNGLLDAVMPVMGELQRSHPKWTAPKKLKARYGACMVELA
jgi:hypothetical protein